MMAGDHFDPWEATESEAIAATLRMGFDPLAVDLVRGPASRLALYLLPADAPLRRSCVARQVLALGEQDLGLVDDEVLQRAALLCMQHGLAPPRWLTLHLLVRSGPAAATDPEDYGKRMTAKCTARRLELRDRRRQRAAWEVMRRYRWKHGANAPKSVLEQAFVNAGRLAEDGDLELALTQAIRRAGMGKTTFQDSLNKAQVLLGPPTWPVAHVPPPLE
jgi:hypothetical protein